MLSRAGCRIYYCVRTHIVVFFFLIPLILVLPLRYGIMGVLLAGPVADFMAFVLFVVLVSIELKKQKMISKEQGLAGQQQTRDYL